MSQNIVIAGNEWGEVPALHIPKSGGGTAQFDDTTDATLNSGAQMLSGVTAYSKGVKYTGSIPSKSAQTYTPTTTDQTIASGQYLTGAQTIKGDTNLVPENIAKGVSIFGVTGAHEGGGGGESAGYNDVNFYDYDGTIVASYSASDFANLTALPENTSHTGLTSQGWNWTLADAKTYVAAYGKLNIGQMYITSDGKTRIYIRLVNGRLSPCLGIAVNGTAVVEWGDGTTNTVTGSSTGAVINTRHTYSVAGDYVIAIAVTGSMALLGSNGSQLLWENSATAEENRAYQRAILKVEIGYNCSIGDNTFSYCYSLISVTIPDHVTSIGNYAFNECHSLTSVTIPDGVTSIGMFAFYSCSNLTSVTIPDGVTSIGMFAFYSCSNLTSITIPDGVTIIDNAVFANCYSLTSVTIPDSVTRIDMNVFSGCRSLTSVTIPDRVTSIGSKAFENCSSLGSIEIPNGVAIISSSVFWGCSRLKTVTILSSTAEIESGAFNGCFSLASIVITSGITDIGNYVFENCKCLGSIKISGSITHLGVGAFQSCSDLTSIEIPNGVTSIYESAFSGCSNLTSITIGSGVTSIGTYAFYNCCSLTSVTIPSSVTSIGNSAFGFCYSLGFIKFMSSTPPTVTNSSAWTSIPTDCIIYVPRGTLTAYTTATNYPDPNTYTYVEED